MKNYKIMKVFDCQWDPGMPDDVKRAFFAYHQGIVINNDVYVSWPVEWDDVNYYDDDERSVQRRLVDRWLIENGAEGRKDKYEGETVLIKHWW